MTNPYYNHGSFPAPNSAGASASMRSELDAITAGFNKLPGTLTANGVIFVKLQCLRCGSPVGSQFAHNDLERRPQDYPPWDQALADKYREELTAHYESVRNNRNRKFWDWYNGYLNTQKWRTLKQRILERANWTCEACGTAEAGQVHHTTYDHVGDEALWELRAVCTPCHDRLHAYKRPWEDS